LLYQDLNVNIVSSYELLSCDTKPKPVPILTQANVTLRNVDPCICRHIESGKCQYCFELRIVVMRHQPKTCISIDLS